MEDKKLAYEKLMAEKNITFDELPDETKRGINGVKKIMHAIKMALQRGQKITTDTAKKLEDNDRWVTRDIFDYIDKKNTNTELPPNNPDQVIKEIESQIKKIDPEEAKKIAEGFAVESELETLHKTGKLDYTLPELKDSTKSVYAVIFRTYKNGEENGIKTSKFTLLEIQETPQTFTLKTR